MWILAAIVQQQPTIPPPAPGIPILEQPAVIGALVLAVILVANGLSKELVTLTQALVKGVVDWLGGLDKERQLRRTAMKTSHDKTEQLLDRLLKENASRGDLILEVTQRLNDQQKLANEQREQFRQEREDWRAQAEQYKAELADMLSEMKVTDAAMQALVTENEALKREKTALIVENGALRKLLEDAGIPVPTTVVVTTSIATTPAPKPEPAPAPPATPPAIPPKPEGVTSDEGTTT
jgi:hypothetical protein